MKLGFSAWAMPDLPIDTVVTHFATLGFDAIEIGVMVQQRLDDDAVASQSYGVLSAAFVDAGIARM